MEIRHTLLKAEHTSVSFLVLLNFVDMSLMEVCITLPWKKNVQDLTLSPLFIHKVSYANSFDPSERPSDSPGSRLFDIQTTFLLSLSDIESLWKSKQTRNSADINLISGLGVKPRVCSFSDVHMPHSAISGLEMRDQYYSRKGWDTNTKHASHLTL